MAAVAEWRVKFSPSLINISPKNTEPKSQPCVLTTANGSTWGSSPSPKFPVCAWSACSQLSTCAWFWLGQFWLEGGWIVEADAKRDEAVRPPFDAPRIPPDLWMELVLLLLLFDGGGGSCAGSCLSCGGVVSLTVFWLLLVLVEVVLLKLPPVDFFAWCSAATLKVECT